RPPRVTLFPYTALFRSSRGDGRANGATATPRAPPAPSSGALASSFEEAELRVGPARPAGFDPVGEGAECFVPADAAGPLACVPADRKSTRLNSSHVKIS